MSHNTQAPKTVLCIKIQITTIYTMCCTAYLNNVGKRHEEGGDLDRLWRTRRQTTQGRRCGGGADAQGETRGGGRAGLCCGDQQEDVCTKRLGAAGTRGARDHVEDG